MIGAPARLLGRMGSPRLLVMENSPSGRYLGYALFAHGTFAGADPKRQAGGREGQSAAPSAALQRAARERRQRGQCLRPPAQPVSLMATTPASQEAWDVSALRPL
jgi:hypothetical protein